MRVTLLGAAGGEVTGSCYVVQTDRANVMIDCGLFQGAHKLENYNRLPQRGPLQRLDAVVLTHCHLDHTGRLPLLTRFGYKGPIHATPATIDLTDLILRDSARLQSEDVRRQNRHRAESGKPMLEPLGADVIDRVPSLGSRAAYAKQAIRDALIEHRQYITRRGEDDPRILGWRWGAGTVAGERRSSTEGDNV